MKNLKVIATVIGFSAAMWAPLALGLLLQFTGGSPSDIGSMAVFGPETTFTCEWASPDGSQAIFSTPSGDRRFIQMDKQSSAEAGKHYRLWTTGCSRWNSKMSLVSA